MQFFQFCCANELCCQIFGKPRRLLHGDLMFPRVVWTFLGFRSIDPLLRADSQLSTLLSSDEPASDPSRSSRCMRMSALVHIGFASADICTLELLRQSFSCSPPTQNLIELFRVHIDRCFRGKAGSTVSRLGSYRWLGGQRLRHPMRRRKLMYLAWTQ